MLTIWKFRRGSTAKMQVELRTHSVVIVGPPRPPISCNVPEEYALVIFKWCGHAVDDIIFEVTKVCLGLTTPQETILDANTQPLRCPASPAIIHINSFLTDRLTTLTSVFKCSSGFLLICHSAVNRRRVFMDRVPKDRTVRERTSER